MSVLRMSLVGAAAALLAAAATPAAAHDGYGERAVVNCVRSVCNFGMHGHHRFGHRRFGHHRFAHRRHAWRHVRVVVPAPYYLVDQGPVYNIPAIPYREPSVAYDIDAYAYPYIGRRSYGPRNVYGGARYGVQHRRYGVGHFHRHVHRSARYAGGVAYGARSVAPWRAHRGARHRLHRHGAHRQGVPHYGAHHDRTHRHGAYRHGAYR